MKFLLTRELGRLATWLRILGYDAAYQKEENQSSLLIKALREERVILTRNQRLPRHTGLKIVLLKSELLKEQIAEVLKALNIAINKDIMFTRCIICNAPLSVLEKEKAKERVPEFVFQAQDTFMACAVCGRAYWQGTHWGNVTNTIEEILRR